VNVAAAAAAAFAFCSLSSSSSSSAANNSPLAPPPGGKDYYLTLRHGIAEVVHGSPLADTPPPVATFELEELTFRQISLKVLSPVVAMA